MVIALPRTRLGCQYRTNYNPKHQIKAKSKKLGTRFLHFGSTIELWFRWTSSWICFRISSSRDAKKGAKAKRSKKGISYHFFVRWLWYYRGRRLTDGSENAQKNQSLSFTRSPETTYHWALFSSHFVPEVTTFPCVGTSIHIGGYYANEGEIRRVRTNGPVCVGWGGGFFTLPSTSSSSSKEKVIPIPVPKKTESRSSSLLFKL
jgi:hypothetical protein